jgi:cyclic-di-AMP phosphodiesterase PgpH
MKKINFHLLLGWFLLSSVTLLLFPNQELALKAETPHLGQTSPRTIIAPISFDVLKNPQELEAEKQKAMDKVHAVFEYNHDETRRIYADLRQTLDEIGKYGELQANITRHPDNPEVPNWVNEAAELFQKLTKRLSTTAVQQLSQNARARDSLAAAFFRMQQNGVSNVLVASTPKAVSLFREMYNTQDTKSILYAKAEVALIKNNEEILVDIGRVRPREPMIEEAFGQLQILFSYNQGLQSAFYEALYVFTLPNVFYLEKETLQRRNEAATQINPSKGMVPRGMEIVNQGSIITKDVMDKLEAMQLALQKERASGNTPTSTYGQFLILLMITSLFSFYFKRFHSKEMTRPAQIWAIVLIAILQVALFSLAHNIMPGLQRPDSLLPEGLDVVWMYPYALSPILVTILFDTRSGLAVAAFSSSILGLLAGYDLAVGLGSYMISWATVFSVNRIRYRSQYLYSMLMGIIALAFTIAVMLLLRNRMSWESYWSSAVTGTIGLVFSVAIVSVLLVHACERLFGITTNLTLMEMSDFNHPALKRLSEFAPGSFHHSIQIGNLAEKAGARIGANTLLIRVMALYHDIGKSMRPEYFTENQKQGVNPHNDLDPYESMKIIRDHVEMGKELAAEYRIPDIVAAGIPEHHGDNIVHYFYHKAKQMYKDREIDPEDFRYAGPRPQSKETAILMLADSIEATSRAMGDTAPEQLAQMVQETIQSRLFEEQLSESGLTIHDLEELEIGFLQSLEGSLHTRIQYPEGVFAAAHRAKTKLQE